MQKRPLNVLKRLPGAIRIAAPATMGMIFLGLIIFQISIRAGATAMGLALGLGLYLIIQVRDMEREKKLAETALGESQLRFRAVFEQTFQFTTLLQPDGTIVDANRATLDLAGLGPGDVKGRHLWDAPWLYHSPAQQKILEQSIKKAAQGQCIRFQASFLGKSKLHQVAFSLKPLLDDQDRIYLLLAEGSDLTEINAVEEALRESENTFRAITDTAKDAIIMIDDEGKITFWSRAGQELLGYAASQIVGRDLHTLLAPLRFHDGCFSGLQRFRHNGQGGAVGKTTELAAVHQRGHEIPVELSLASVKLGERWHGVGILRDISERKTIEERIQQTQRLESLGTLAGGIAHDFNNLLMGIQGRTSLALADTPCGAPHCDRIIDHLRSIEDYIKSAVSLTRQLLGFARSGKYEVKPTDINELVRKTAEMFGRTKKELRVTVATAPGLQTCNVDRGQIEQALLNIYINAGQAMPDGGDLEITTQNCIPDKALVDLHQATPGEYVKLSIADTGTGMPPDVLNRIFEPFFTTKEMARGTGLGLASAFGIVKNHAGFIVASSQVGTGSRFDIYLPAIKAKAESIIDARPQIQNGSERILLVDDEEIILEVGQAILKKLGYKVMTAHGGQDAIDQFGRRRAEIDLVIMDMIMPDLDGEELFAKLKRVDPNVKILLSSGYSMNNKAEKIMNQGCNGFIQKPFDLTNISMKLREILTAGDIAARPGDYSQQIADIQERAVV